MPRPAPIRVLAGWRNRYRDDAVDSDAQRRASPASWLAQSIAAPVSFSPIVFGGSAGAVHDTGAFELDGNPTSSAATPGDDWDNVCHQAAPTICPTGSNTTGATAVSFTNDGPV